MMTARRSNRTASVVALICAVLLFHVAAIVPLVIYWPLRFPKSRNEILAFGVRLPGSSELLGIRKAPDQVTNVFCAIDPYRGTIRDLDIQFPVPLFGAVADEKRLWLASLGSVIEWDGTQSIVHLQQPILNAPLGAAFLFEGSLAIVDQDDAGVKYRLRVFHDKEWHDRGEVAIPPLGSRWHVDSLTGEKELRPPWSTRTVVSPGQQQAIRVIEAGGKLGVLLWDFASSLTAYRDSLDLVEDQPDVASASRPENARADSYGWIDPGFKPGLWSVAASNERLVIVTQPSQTEPIRILEKNLNPPGQPFKVTTELKSNSWDTLMMLYLPTSDEWYFIRDRDVAQKFYRYRDGELREAAPLWENDLMEVTKRARPVMAEIVAILVIGLALFIAGAEWICRSETGRYGFGTTSVQLAPIWRRCVARAIDLVLIFIPLTVGLSQLGFYRIASDGLDLWDDSLFMQSATARAIVRGIISGVAVSVMQVVIQGRWGFTVGKWLCGLRVRAATLRPCGFSRSLLRDVLLCIDAPALLTVIPGIASMLTTDHRARLGDRIADTIVVMSKQEKGSQPSC